MQNTVRMHGTPCTCVAYTLQQKNKKALTKGLFMAEPMLSNPNPRIYVGVEWVKSVYFL